MASITLDYSLTEIDNKFMTTSETVSLAAAVLSIIASAYLGFTGAISWDAALPIMLGGLAVLGVHPAINTTPSNQ